MSYDPAVADMIGISEETKIPYWRFAVGLGLRPAMHYEVDDIEWLGYNIMHISHLKPHGYNSEDFYAMVKRHDALLLALAEKAETDEEIDYVLNNLAAFPGKAGEVIAQKAMRLRRPKDYPYHERSLKGKNAERAAHLELAETEDDLWPLMYAPTPMELPCFDTVTEHVFRKMIGVTVKLSTLQWICNCTSTTRLTDIQFEVAARAYALFKASKLVT